MADQQSSGTQTEERGLTSPSLEHYEQTFSEQVDSFGWNPVQQMTAAYFEQAESTLRTARRVSEIAALALTRASIVADVKRQVKAELRSEIKSELQREMSNRR